VISLRNQMGARPDDLFQFNVIGDNGKEAIKE
jgi:hypothetical protein